MPSKPKEKPVTATLRPCDAVSLADVLSLPRDNWNTPSFWLITDGVKVTITAQRNGEAATASIEIPRRQFNQLLRGYQREYPRRKVRP